eukprot:CAMPEP_0201633344 /NCGR_PEP_ID=MMETSP0493-20130528/6680_1 /ASSEMBLY_ACC=CAM_ASM_000838 /TAXON_ID=420259 /ORGANISM="Thalassiosira gravida, Strain GMp14c1" /LENGTH=301 /DNA_ID=CAMNT_0048105039 /DNA_START=407 /DNA_END=1312 /DNA_ORIENTATION=-
MSPRFHRPGDFKRRGGDRRHRRCRRDGNESIPLPGAVQYIKSVRTSRSVERDFLDATRAAGIDDARSARVPVGMIEAEKHGYPARSPLRSEVGRRPRRREFRIPPRSRLSPPAVRRRTRGISHRWIEIECPHPRRNSVRRRSLSFFVARIRHRGGGTFDVLPRKRPRFARVRDRPAVRAARLRAPHRRSDSRYRVVDSPGADVAESRGSRSSSGGRCGGCPVDPGAAGAGVRIPKSIARMRPSYGGFDRSFYLVGPPFAEDRERAPQFPWCCIGCAIRSTPTSAGIEGIVGIDAVASTFYF